MLLHLRPDAASRVLQFQDETDSTTSGSIRSRPPTTIPRRIGTQPNLDPQQRTPNTTPLTIRTSSLKVSRQGGQAAAPSSSAYSFADETKSHQAVTLQTPLLSAEDRSSSDRINQWSSSDLSSLHSYSVISVPVTSYDRTRPHQGSTMLGASFSSSGGGGVPGAAGVEGSSSRFSSPAGRLEGGGSSSRGGSDASANVANPPISAGGRTTSVEAAEEIHKLRLQL